MIEPHQRILHGLNRHHLRQLRPRRHNYRETQCARRRDLGVTGGAAAVLCHYDIDVMGTEQRTIVLFRERTPCSKVRCTWNCERRIDGVDAAYEIIVLRRPREGSQFLAAERQKDSTRRAPQGIHHRRHVRYLDPAVIGDGRPTRPAHRQQRHPSCLCCTGRIGGNDACVGMRPIDKHIDSFRPQIVGKSLNTAEPADPYRHWLTGWQGSPASERQGHDEIRPTGQALRQGSRLRRPAEDEDTHGSS
jgi:hypothetical protein